MVWLSDTFVLLLTWMHFPMFFSALICFDLGMCALKNVPHCVLVFLAFGSLAGAVWRGCLCDHAASSEAAVRCGCQVGGVLVSRRLGGCGQVSDGGTLRVGLGCSALVLPVSCIWVGVQELGVPLHVEGATGNKDEAMVVLPTDPEEHKQVRSALARLVEFQAAI